MISNEEIACLAQTKAKASANHKCAFSDRVQERERTLPNKHQNDSLMIALAIKILSAFELRF